MDALTQAQSNQLRQIQSLYEAGSYDQALDRLNAFAKSNTKAGQGVQAQNLRGLILLAQKNPGEAASAFKSALSAAPASSNLSNYLLYNLATAQLESGDATQALKTTDEARTSGMDRATRAKLHYLRGKILIKQKQPMESSREILLAARFAQPEVAPQFGPALDQSLAEVADPMDIENLYRDFEDSPLADHVLLRLGSAEISAGNEAAGSAHLRTLMSRFPQSPLYAQANEMSRSQRRDIPVKPKTVGVLLPMKGKFAGYGTRSLQGIELAFRIFNGNEPDPGYSLVIEDSGEDATQALKALDRLVLKHQAVAVIGPLLSKGVDQITQRAEELGVPLLSLARSEGTRGDYIFQSGLTLRLQAQAMADYAIRTLGMRRFAILHPKDKVGEETSNYFWNEVEKQGGEIRGIESYAPTDRDFRQVVDKLSGLYYTEARQDELDALAKLRQENQIRKRTRKTEQYFSLKPVVDYEAVFLPEEPNLTGQILPTFAYRDVDDVRFLGTAVWNSPELPQSAQNYAEKTLFVDAFFPKDPSPAARKFIDGYKTTYGDDPIGMDALAYDAARVLEQALARAGNSPSRSRVREELARTEGYPGVTGTITYRDGLFSRDLKVLTVKGGQIVPVQNLPVGSR